jgi:3-oxoadipate enol-lactonase
MVQSANRSDLLAMQESIPVRDGTRLAYRLTKGNGSGRVVLIHSLAMDGSFWDRVVPLLQEHADVLVYDCRGHGQSDKAKGPYTVELFADDLADLLDHIGWRSATICGASMGGTVAVAFAAAYPDRVDALGLFDTTCWYGPQAPAQWAERAQKALDDGMQALVGFQKTRWFSDGFREKNPGIDDRAIEVFLANDVRCYAETCRMLGAADKRDALKNFRMPCAIVVGSEDYATPVAMARVLEAGIAGARLEVIEHVRHLTPLEVPETVARKILTLIKPA